MTTGLDDALAGAFNHFCILHVSLQSEYYTRDAKDEAKETERTRPLLDGQWPICHIFNTKASRATWQCDDVKGGALAKAKTHKVKSIAMYIHLSSGLYRASLFTFCVHTCIASIEKKNMYATRPKEDASTVYTRPTRRFPEEKQRAVAGAQLPARLQFLGQKGQKMQFILPVSARGAADAWFSCQKCELINCAERCERTHSQYTCSNDLQLGQGNKRWTEFYLHHVLAPRIVIMWKRKDALHCVTFYFILFPFSFQNQSKFIDLCSS